MKRILFISPQPFFQWRGSPIRVGFNVQALAELGFAVDLLTLPLGEKREIPGVTVHRVANLPGVRNIPIGPSLAKAVFDLLLLLRGRRLARQNRYDVVHAVEDAGPAGVFIARAAGAKLVFEKHSDPSSYRKGPLRNLVMALYARVERFTVRHADAVIGTGPGLVRQVRDMCPGKPAHHIPDIPSSLVEASPEQTAQHRRQLQQKPDELLVMYVGSFAVYQGVDLMFQAMPAVLARCPRVRFVVIGGTPEEIAARRAWLAERGIGNAVTFPGKIHPDQLPDVLAAADILLSPRVAGVNTPLKILDYLKTGRPVVAADTEANRLLLDDRTALLTPPTAAGFAGGVMRLAEAPDLCRRLGENGLQRVASTYNYREFKKGLKACYDGLGLAP